MRASNSFDDDGRVTMMYGSMGTLLIGFRLRLIKQLRGWRMLKFLGGTVGIVFLIGLIVVVGIFMLIF